MYTSATSSLMKLGSLAKNVEMSSEPPHPPLPRGQAIESEEVQGNQEVSPPQLHANTSPLVRTHRTIARLRMCAKRRRGLHTPPETALHFVRARNFSNFHLA